MPDTTFGTTHGIPKAVLEAFYRRAEPLLSDGYKFVSKIPSPIPKERLDRPGEGGGGTPIHYLYGYVPRAPNGVVSLKLLIWNGVSISEAFFRTGYNISNARKLQFCMQPFENIQDQVAFKNTVQFTNFLERSINHSPIFTRKMAKPFPSMVMN